MGLRMQRLEGTDWNEEGQGLPGARLGRPEDVPPAEGVGEGRPLDGCHRCEARLLQPQHRRSRPWTLTYTPYACY